VIDIVTDPYASDTVMRVLWQSAWNSDGPPSFQPILLRSLVHVGAFEGEAMVGFINVAWDGRQHGFILDTCVYPQWRRRGIASLMVKRAVAEAKARGVHWLHVDFEPHLEGFYFGCGFRHTGAGVMQL
jgi:ribosomal protein S18 acetylase RimI-like enzyme